MGTSLAWGIIGTGGIANSFASGLVQSTTGLLLAVGSRTQAKADAFGAKYAAPRCYGSYEALLADPDVQAVYICTPHPQHAEWAIKAAQAGKHILCEKPITLNYPDAMAVVEAARRHGVFLMEAFMYRCHPQTAALVEELRAGAIGEVRLIEATFSFDCGTGNPEGRLMKHELGGGGILDVGCYCASMARLIAGVATGQPFAEPLTVTGAGHIGSTRVDDYAVATLTFPGDIIAQLSTGMQLNQENVVRIYGTQGSIVVPSPWFCNRWEGTPPSFTVTRYGEQPRVVEIPVSSDIYGIEADLVAASLPAQQAASPAMSWDDTLSNMRTLDRWRKAIGLIYDCEQPTANIPPVSRQPLAARADHVMTYGQIAGIDKPVSRLVMGTMLEGMEMLLPQASAHFDEFVMSGGNCFDTAHIYAGGMSERIFGQWVKNRGIREQVVILGKGAHTPNCTPEGITTQLMESLERLQMDYVDIYMMHRDNLDVPVSEFIDVLNAHVRAGRMRAFGGSNWSIERVEEANAYAQAHGLQGFAAVSNNFSLARMVDPIWGGTISASDPASRAWFTRTQLPLMAWSSQARGFFVRGDRNFQADGELVRCWYSDDNFQRMERVRELAARYNVSPINIALAYVLCQPFPTFALFGPQKLAEIPDSLRGVAITLTPDEVRWLNLEADAVPA